VTSASSSSSSVSDSLESGELELMDIIFANLRGSERYKVHTQDMVSDMPRLTCTDMQT
jgi:hypothetical protein